MWRLVVKEVEVVEAARFHGSGWLRHCEAKQGSARRDVPCTMATVALAGVTSITGHANGHGREGHVLF